MSMSKCDLSQHLGFDYALWFIEKCGYKYTNEQLPLLQPRLTKVPEITNRKQNNLLNNDKGVIVKLVA